MASVMEEMAEPDVEEQQMEAEQRAVEPPSDEELAAARQQEPEPDQAEPEQKPELEKTVEYGALHQERMRRKELEQQMQTMEQRFNILLEKMGPPKVQEEERIPAYDEDPGAHLLNRLQKTEMTASQIAEQMKARQESEKQTQQLQQWSHSFQMRESQFAKEHADYYDAVEHLKQSRMQEYIAVGWQPEQAMELIRQEAVQLGMDADQKGEHPAERFYKLAKVRGWSGKAASSDPAEAVQRLQKNVARAGNSLDSSSKGTRKPTLADLADLDDEEFDRITDGDAWKRLWNA